MTRRPEPQPHRTLSAVLAGMVGAWLWTTFGKKILDRIPVWWRVVGGLLIGSALLFIDGLEWFGWLLLVASVGLAVVTITRRRKAAEVDRTAAVAAQWASVVEENEKLRRVLRGSRLERKAKGEPLFPLTIYLANGYTAVDVAALQPNLESVFGATLGSLLVRADPEMPANVAVVVVRPQAPTPSGPIIDMEPVEVEAEEPPWRMLLPRARVADPRGRTRTRTRGNGMSETVRLAELKRRKEVARSKGEPIKKGGHRRAKR